jgi:peptidoglycan hydrolase-like protein with peptidoglycan-binding domain
LTYKIINDIINVVRFNRNKNLQLKNKNMIKNKHYWGISILLLALNLILGVLYVLQPVNRVPENSVLGANDTIPVFESGYVMSNQTFQSTRVFNSESAVQNYLNQANSPLKNYRDNGQLASYWIWNAARGNTSAKYGVTPQLNPGLLMGFLEKEQSLISASNYNTQTDPERRIRTAMGYGCPDDAKCDTQFYGLANQLNWSAYQLQYNFNRAGNPASTTPYKKNSTVTTLDKYNVFLQNEATASVYNYTPHVYWGNYNLWKILTANGWGVSSNTYSMRDIDQVNIYSKKIDPGATTSSEKIDKSAVAGILAKNYNLGDQSTDIELMQKYLRQEGYYTYVFITGYYGGITKQSHDAYKTAQSNGISAPVTPTPTTPTPVVVNVNCNELFARNWVDGQIGEDVKQLQECLRKEGLYSYAENTGYFGTVTKKSLADYKIKITPQAPQPVQNTVNCDELRVRNWVGGAISQEVRQLQKCMRDRGFFTYSGGDTGYNGPVTQDALKAWIKSLQPVVDRCTQLKDKQWEFGKRNPEVIELQKCMKEKGFYTWPYITDYFGPVTNEALNKWRVKTPPVFECADLKKQSWVKGEVSERVRQLQACMRAEGKFNFAGGNTGYFGNSTEAGLVAWRGYF